MISSRWPRPIGTSASIAFNPVCTGSCTERRGEITAEVTAAQPLNEAQQNTLGEQLRRAVGRRVMVDIRVDPSLLGGMIIKVGSRMIDGSLKSRLQRLQLAMKGIG